MDHSKEIKVSIGLPTFNRAKLLGRAIDSIISQSFSDFELIVVDDGSADNTKEVVRAYKDTRIRYVLHDKNKGLMASRNTALSESQGEYIAFQDSDDWWHRDFLEESLAILEKTPDRVGGVHSRIEKQYRNGTQYSFPNFRETRTEGNLLELMLGGGYLITLQAFVMKKMCFEQVGVFDEDFRVFGDAEFIIRFAKHYEFVFNANTRAYLEVQEDSISRNKKGRLKAREMLYRKHAPLFEKFPAAHAKYLSDLGWAFAKNGEKEKACLYVKSAAAIRPWRADYWFRTLLSYLS